MRIGRSWTARVWSWWPGPQHWLCPLSSPAVSWRNRLAYTVFSAELALAQDDRLTWDMLGVPLALVGFDTSWKAQFVDRSAVVRAGGLPRSRYVLPAQPTSSSTPLLVQPALAQARVSQLTEQINAQQDLTSLVPAFAILPPCGVLPAAAMDFIHHTAPWFPSNWKIAVGPVHQEEIETALLSGMTAQPLDATQNESIEVLVPLPDALYDPDVLVTETVAPAFQDAVNSATAELAGDLQHRKAIQQEANALSQVLTGAQQAARYDLDAGLTAPEITLRDAQVYVPTSGEAFGTTSTPITETSPQPTYSSVDYQKLINDAGNPPYTITLVGSDGTTTTLPLFLKADFDDLDQNGLQHFIDRISAKISRANDLLDLAFLTTQSDIYRFRQYVLGAAGATDLAVSPIAAQIATGESAASTSANLQSYLNTILQAKASAPSNNPSVSGVGAATFDRATQFQTTGIATTLRPPSLINSPTAFRKNPTFVDDTSFGGAGRATFGTGASGATFSTGASGATFSPTGSRATFSATASRATLNSALSSATFSPIEPGTVSQPATPTDVVAQSPLVGAQLNLRTLTIAQRLANPPSQEGIFYAVGNRLAFVQLLADLEITIDDIPILVDQWPFPPATTTTAAQTTSGQIGLQVPLILPTFHDFRATPSAVLAAVEAPRLNLDSDEADLFSTGIHVLEQHSQLLRAVEGRIAQYNDFLAECRTALTNIQSDLPQAQTLLTQLENALAQGRQDVAFTTALLNDEIQRVANVNDQRTYTLQNYVQVVAFTRPRTLVTAADVPSRQLVPGNIASPVPTCLSQSVTIPAELREITSLLREAPVGWMPAIQALLNKLERPILLQEFAFDSQARAVMQLQLPLRVSSAASRSGVYAPAIASIYSNNQQTFRAFQTERAAFQPNLLINQSWISQIQTLQYITATADLLASEAVHAEVVNATSRLMQQISSVATCLYARAGQALPINRLAWAEFLRGLGFSIQLQSLAVLPNWNTQEYVSRQQMQLLVDWLFQQIDTTNSAAVAFMSDVVRVAILLASDAPVSAVIGGAVTLATTPKVGGIVSLTLPSDRVVHGMYVQLYSSGVLAAQAVVTDLDSSSVRATVTQVYQTGVTLQANDVAHYTSQRPQAVALRAFDM